MQKTISALDMVISRILFVTPSVAEPVVESPAVDDGTEKAERVFGLSLAVAGLRCILQYMVLPFILPAIGLASGVSAAISFVITVVAAVSLIISIRHLWQIDYNHKWAYLGLAVPAFAALIGFLVLDVQVFGLTL